MHLPHPTVDVGNQTPVWGRIVAEGNERCWVDHCFALVPTSDPLGLCPACRAAFARTPGNVTS